MLSYKTDVIGTCTSVPGKLASRRSRFRATEHVLSMLSMDLIS